MISIIGTSFFPAVNSTIPRCLPNRFFIASASLPYSNIPIFLIKRFNPHQYFLEKSLKEGSHVLAHSDRLRLVEMVNLFAHVRQLVHQFTYLLVGRLGPLLLGCHWWGWHTRRLLRAIRLL